MSAITLKLGIKDARKLASMLVRELPTEYVEELKIQLEDYDRNRREQEERRKRELIFRKQQEAKEAECRRKGHLEPIYENQVTLIDARTLDNSWIQIPSCSRCGESLVILADGSLKEWLSWTKTREALHNSMRISPKADCREATSSPTRRSLDQFLFA